MNEEMETNEFEDLEPEEPKELDIDRAITLLEESGFVVTQKIEEGSSEEYNKDVQSGRAIDYLEDKRGEIEVALLDFKKNEREALVQVLKGEGYSVYKKLQI